MYSDQSRNPLTAMQGVDMLLSPMLHALEMHPPRSVRYDNGVSLETYNRLIEQYNELVAVSKSAILSLRLRAMELEVENLRLKAKVADVQRR